MSPKIAVAAFAAAVPAGIFQSALRVAGRYGLSTFGTMAIAGAHFIAALAFLRALPPAEFGLVSFAFVAVPPLLSATMSLVAASLLTTMYREKAVAQSALTTNLKANLCISVLVAALLAALLFAVGAGVAPSLLFGAYGGLMSSRQFARALGYIDGRPFAVTASDVTYSAVLLFGLAALFIAHAFSLLAIAGLLAAAAATALVPFGRAFLAQMFSAGFTGWLEEYSATFRDLARWSLLGVVSTEMTVNAHAYLVTLIAGPQSFALLAVGALFLRPVSLFLTALPEMERPAMVRGIVNGDMAEAFRPVKTFRLATAAAWLVTIALTAAVLTWFPGLVLKSHYAAGDVAVVVMLWAAIMAVRIVRTPDGVLMQAAAEFKRLAGASVGSAGVSIVLTLALLLLWGPIASLGGILVGELVMMVRLRVLIRDWRRRQWSK
jgi:hypothetical protein